MVIDSSFDQNWERTGEENGIAVWRLVEPPKKPGVHDTHVAAGYDTCPADGACPKNCFVDMLTRVDAPDHPVSEKKVKPASEDQCIDCVFCADIYPVNVIDVDTSRQA